MIQKGSLFEVTYMPWEKFRDGVMTFKRMTIEEISRQQCVMGGIDYTIDYR